MNGQKQVIAAVIQRDGKFLLGKRSLSKKSAPGYWCPVTGAIETGESEPQALVREVLEETGLMVEPVAKVGEFDTRDGSARIHWWSARLVGADPSALLLPANDEHTELRWVSVAEMGGLRPIFEEDVELFRRLAEGIGGT